MRAKRTSKSETKIDNTVSILEQSDVPTEKLIVGLMMMMPSTHRDEAIRYNIDAFARQLVAAGKRPWFEVFYPSSNDLSDQAAVDWMGREPDTGDIVELVDFEIFDGEAVGGSVVVIGAA